MTDKKNFITKLIIFLLFSCIVPCAYLSIRFNLFVSKSRLSLWGLIMVAVVFIIISILIKFYIDGMKLKWSYFKQILTGFIKVILPLLFLLILTFFIKNHIEEIIKDLNLVIECLGVIIASEIIAICVNPLSKWAFENNVNGLLDITDKIFKKGEE